MKPAVALCLCTLPVFGQYSARRDGAAVRLEDARRQTVVTVAPSIGNAAFEMKVKAKDVLRFPAVMWLQGKSQKVEVAIGPNYKAVVVYIYPHGPSDSSGACPDVLSALLIGRPAGNHERSLCPAHARAEVCSAALAGLLPEPAPAEE